MFYRKKYIKALDRIISKDELIAKLQEEVKTIEKNRDFHMDLKTILGSFKMFKDNFDSFGLTGSDFDNANLVCQTINDGEPAIYVDDLFGGKVIKQEAHKAIRIDNKGNVTIGLTKKEKSKYCNYTLEEDKNYPMH